MLLLLLLKMVPARLGSTLLQEPTENFRAEKKRKSAIGVCLSDIFKRLPHFSVLIPIGQTAQLVITLAMSSNTGQSV